MAEAEGRQGPGPCPLCGSEGHDGLGRVYATMADFAAVRMLCTEWEPGPSRLDGLWEVVLCDACYSRYWGLRSRPRT